MNHDASTDAAVVGEKARLGANSEEIKPIAFAVIELHLSEGISQLVRQSVRRKMC